MKILDNGQLNFIALEEALKKPPVYTKSTTKFWDDAHIAKQMLQFHLNPEIEAASKKAETIASEIRHIVKVTKMKHKTVLDLGCGPGLYINGFADHAESAVGIDLSQFSLDYALQTVGIEKNNVQFKKMNYLALEYTAAFDVITMIFYDFGALNFDEQANLLKKVHTALKPNGIFVFDVLTSRCPHSESSSTKFYRSGFFSEEPYMEIHQKLFYSDSMVRGDQYVLISESGDLRIIRNYDRLFNETEITDLLKMNGFSIIQLDANLSGDPYTSDSTTMGIFVKKCEK